MIGRTPLRVPISTGSRQRLCNIAGSCVYASQNRGFTVSTSKMEQLKEQKNGAQNNTWIGHAGAAGRDLRSELS